jgi:single-stranded-DNA-specific exonuclease
VRILKIKNWHLAKLDKVNAQKIACQNNIPFFLAMMLDVRNIVDEKRIHELLSDEFEVSNPFEFIDMDKAVDRIQKAINSGEKICVYGDYDADGVTSTALLYLYLENCEANVIYYIPDRNSEGYGLNFSAIDKLFAEKVSLIITVDNGISAFDEVAYANSLGIETVITDHHQPPELLPNAVAIVDPHRSDCKSSFKNLAGVGVVFKLVCALEGSFADVEFILENYSDLILIGTIGDVVPLIGENRYLVKQGLKYIKNTNNLGVQEILNLAKLTEKPINSTNIAFNVVPRINASGRLSFSKKLVQLLTSENQLEVQNIATQVEDDNIKRKEIENEILLQAEELLKNEPVRAYQRVLIVEGENWHPGVIGIVAARLLEKYGKPTVVISKMGDVARGSCRSIEGFSLYEAIKTCAKYLVRFGGHPLAAGFELKCDDLNKFKNDINNFAKNFGVMPCLSLNIDCKLNSEALSLDLIEQLDPLEPFGKDNPEFTFGLYNMKICDMTFVGAEKNHLRLTLSRNSHKITAMKFFTTAQYFSYEFNDEVDLAVKLSKSEFRGQESLTLIIDGIKFSGLDNKLLIDEQRVYESIKRNEQVNSKLLQEHTPSRADFSVLYKFLKANNPINIDISVLYYRLKDFKISFCKLLIMLDAMAECGLITVETIADVYLINVKPVNGKVDLESSVVMKFLRK